MPRGKRPPVPLIQIDEVAVPLYRSPRWWERFAAVTGLTLIVAVLGAVVATLFAAMLIWGITTMSGLLK